MSGKLLPPTNLRKAENCDSCRWGIHRIAKVEDGFISIVACARPDGPAFELDIDPTGASDHVCDRWKKYKPEKLPKDWAALPLGRG